MIVVIRQLCQRRLRKVVSTSLSWLAPKVELPE